MVLRTDRKPQVGLSSQEPAQFLCSSKHQKQDKWRFWQKRGGSAPLSTRTQPDAHQTRSRCEEGRPTERSHSLPQGSPIILTSKLRPSSLRRAARLPTGHAVMEQLVQRHQEGKLHLCAPGPGCNGGGRGGGHLKRQAENHIPRVGCLGRTRSKPAGVQTSAPEISAEQRYQQAHFPSNKLLKYGPN